ncbi:MAG: GAF domain-containing protein [Ekhidna sp.]
MSEQDRIEELRSLGILDSESEKDFDEIVELVSDLCQVPISLITLIDEKRQWFKAKKGIDISETAREHSFCHFTIENPNEVMVVENTLEDPRFSNNPFVINDPNVRFYAGFPLVTKNNFALGTLCIIDDKPRKLSENELRVLQILGRRVVALIELRRENILQRKLIEDGDKKLSLVTQRLIKAQEVAKVGSWDWDVKDGTLYWSPQMYEIFGLDECGAEALIEKWQSAVYEEDLALVKNTLAEGLNGKHNAIQYRVKRGTEFIWVETAGQVTVDKKGAVVRMMGTVQEITEVRKAFEQKQLYSEVLEQMLFDLSHKIRRPLTNCIALSSLLQDPESLDGREREFAQYLEKSANTLDAYLKETIDFLNRNKVNIEDLSAEPGGVPKPQDSFS